MQRQRLFRVLSIWIVGVILSVATEYGPAWATTAPFRVTTFSEVSFQNRRKDEGLSSSAVLISEQTGVPLVLHPQKATETAIFLGDTGSKQKLII